MSNNEFAEAGIPPWFWHAGCSFEAPLSKEPEGILAAMFRLDYLSCFLTIVGTVLVGRKNWTGLLLSGVNSAVVCVIGLHTSQYGFIPANLFCICINAVNMRKWRNLQKSSHSLASCRPHLSRTLVPRLESASDRVCLNRSRIPYPNLDRSNYLDQSDRNRRCANRG